MMQSVFLFVLFAISNQEWRLIHSDFYQESISSSGSWDFKDTCAGNSIKSYSDRQCGTNPLQFLRIKDGTAKLENEFYYPHYQLRVITDVIYIRAKSGANSVFKVSITANSVTQQLYSRTYQQSTLQTYDKVCSQDCGSGGGCNGLDENRIEIKTLILDNIVHSYPIFTLSYCFTYADDMMRIGFRNIIIYAKACHISCLTCNGDTQYDCLTCYQGTPTGGVCKCDEQNSYVHILTGCTQECNRNYYLTDSSRYCQFDPRIQQKISYFTTTTITNGNLLPYAPWVFIADPFAFKNNNLKVTCNGEDLIGYFNNYEIMQLQLGTQKNLGFIRLRISFYLFGFQPDSEIRITLDSYSNSKIIKTLTNYTYTSADLIKYWTSSCSGNSYDYLRIESVLNVMTRIPVIKLFALTKLTTEQWAFRNVTIDYGLCTSNCTECETFSRCKICDTGYQLYRGTCVGSCPVYTNTLANGTCQDYEDEIKNSRYLIKAFYDTNTTFEEVTAVVDNFTLMNDAIQTSFTGSIYSFVPEKSVLGGVLVWQSGKFKKTFTSLSPHYQISYRLNVTYGDENPGWFKYQFGTDISAQINNPNNCNRNSLGDTKKETTKYISGLQRPHSNSKLDIILQGDTTKASLEDAFIYVSEYFVVVHYCAPFCSVCNGPEISDCTTGNYVGYNSTSYCASNQYLNLDSSTSVYSCINCPQVGCTECTSSDVCTRCEYSNSNKFMLVQGTCQCYPSQFQSSTNCLQCNKFCETCFGSNIDQCYTCVTEFHRSVYKFQCKCIPGYYDDNFNLECYPICGDQLVVDGEDCDDGNNNPFDGCDQCEFQCQESCLDCQHGLCYECQNNYQLVSIHKCFPICGDNLTVGDEECDDGNVYPFDGCYKCKFQCYDHCIDCFEGICRKCDEIHGWYLTGVSCEPQCGDGIVVSEIEDCDDKNYNPFDLCDACKSNCAEFCEICSLGHCVKCKDGFSYNKKTKMCQPICGDFKIIGNEECDDNNFAIYDGCYKCHFQCQTSCIDCVFGKCYQCSTGWQINLQTNLCEQILDDGIVLYPSEQCDDKNSNPMDGCFQQYYECQDSCMICYNGLCIRCKDGWQLNKQNNQCIPVCGDGKIVENEYCDDANSLVYDSCFQCKFICNSNCQTCIYGKCKKCNEGYQLVNNKCLEICGDGIQTQEELCEDGLILYNQQCLQCKYFCNDGCKVCVQGICEQCKKGYQLENYSCYPICGDKQVSGDEECDDGNNTPFDGCNMCKFECQQECNECKFNRCLDCDYGFNIKEYKCYEECGNEIVTKTEFCDDGNLEPFDGCYDCNYSCDSECEICEFGKCYKCKSNGWIVNQVDNTCQPYCGDLIVVGSEQCDDGNNLRYDGCYECFFECQDECTKCLAGSCYECNTTGWMLDNYQCIPICGDQLVLGYEQCDDGNNIPYDGCFNCQYQCQDECTLCDTGICKECNTLGWTLIQNLCSPKCGDGILIEILEQCDDGNDDQYDGCYQCQYQCQLECEECEKGFCESCQLGWIVSKGRCVPFCGDFLIVGNEQCDNGLQQIATCVNCQQVCDKNCQECDNGVCLNCIQGLYLNNYLECLPVCGDGFAIFEDCDDGNKVVGDGCNQQCQIEDGWVCVKQNSFSQCFFSEQPKMILELLTKNPENIEEASIKFNLPMKLFRDENAEANNYFQGNITNLFQDQYKINFSFAVKPLYKETQQIQVIVTIEFFENIESPLLLVTLLEDTLISEYQSQVLDNQQYIVLRTPIVLSADQINNSENAKSFTYIIIYFLIALSCICFLTGSFEMFWNLMDLLQYLSYIKYVNIVFPTNLNIYFEVFKLISLQPIMDFLGISSIFGLLDGGQEYSVQTSEKFKMDDINGYFFTNFQSTIFCYFGLFGFYFFAKISLKILYQFGPYHMSYVGYYPSKLIYVLRQILDNVKKEFYYGSILRVLLSNQYDICFSVFIQLINFTTTDKVLLINSYAALAVLSLQFIFFVYVFNTSLSFASQSTFKKTSNYSSLVEGVQQNKCLWTGQYNTILLLKKQIFIFLIVYMENNGTLQAICVAVNQSVFFTYIWIFKPLTQLQEYRKLLVAESLLAFNSLLFLAYAYRIELELSVENYILIGWFHIASFSFILGYSLIYDLKNQLYSLYQKIKNRFQQKSKIIQSSQIVFY